MAEYGSFDYESYQDRQSILHFLESLREGFAKGKITLSTGTDAIVLEPKDLLNFRMKAKKKQSRSKLELKISWKEGMIESTKEKLKIGSSIND
jgi:amphi-Trp domain-containing protein